MTNPNQTWIAADISNGRLTAWRLKGRTVEEKVTGPAGPGIAESLAQAAPGWAHMDRPVLINSDLAIAFFPVPAKPANLVPQADASQPNLHFLTGLSTTAPVGVLPGATARIAGFLALNADWDGVICLPGTATHWALVSAGEVVEFQSFLTVDLFRMTVAAMGVSAQPNLSEIPAAAADTMSRPELLAARLAETKASQLLSSPSEDCLSARIWGYLLGAELAASRSYWLGQNLALIADDSLAAPYQAALQAQGLPVTLADADRMTLEGLITAHAMLQP